MILERWFGKHGHLMVRWTDRSLTGLLLLAAPAVLLLGAVTLCPGKVCTTPAIDHAGLTLAIELQRPWLSTVMGFATWGGSLLVLAPIALWHAARALPDQPLVKALRVPIALAGATLLAQGVKWWIDRPRPVELPVIDLPIDPSFPSAHAMQITAVAVALLGAGRSPGKWLIAAALIGMVGFSRIYLQVHFVTDVVLGTLAALFWVIALQRLIKESGTRK